MALVKMNSCYGCPECRHCGRDRDFVVLECDGCGDELEGAWVWNGKHFCLDCFLKQFPQVEYCHRGCEEDDYYLYEGKGYCADCLMKELGDYFKEFEEL